MKVNAWILPLIVLAQFCCTSLWFAGNAVIADLALDFQLTTSSIGWLTSAVQFGFIVGTLTFAILSVADLFSPSRVFMYAAFAGALCNWGATLEFNTLMTLFGSRFLTGFFLAGIYPVGMKIAADYFDKRLGKSLGFLVGALVLGTAFPHLVKGLGTELAWQTILWSTSGLAVFGGLLIGFLVPDGPFRKAGQQLDFTASFKVFKNSSFRRAALGYFGHMWELYAFWTFVPLMILAKMELGNNSSLNYSIWAFAVIAMGGVGCVMSGYLSQRLGAKKVALTSLLLSGLCCLLYPLCYFEVSLPIFLTFLLFWGTVVVADSPLFSTLVAKSAPAELKGTALTVVNCIGFAITIVSIQLLSWVWSAGEPGWVCLLALGPVLVVVFPDRELG